MSSPIKILDYKHHDNFISEFLFDVEALNLKEIIKYFEVMAKSEQYMPSIEPRTDIRTKDTQLFLNQTLSYGDSISEAAMANTMSVYYQWHKVVGLGLGEYMEKYEILKTRGYEHKFCKIQRTKPSEGFHTWHYDAGTVSPHRQLVTLLYLNGDFDGGETEFLYQNVRIKPQAGKFIIFPPFWTHTHRGNPPIGGTKYIVTSWADCFPQFKGSA